MAHTYNGADKFDENKDASHYGMPRRSGRYPYGSGENPYQHENRNLLGRIKQMEDEGMSQKDIATALGYMKYNPKTGKVEGNINMLREKRRIAGEIVKKADMQEVWNHYYKDKMSVDAIAEEMHLSSGTVRNYIKPEHAERQREKDKALDQLRDEVNDKKYIDVGKGGNAALGVTANTLRHKLVPQLEAEGYELHTIRVQQLGTGNYTNMQVLCQPGTQKKDLYKHIEEIMPLGKFTINDNGETKLGMLPPKNLDSSRLQINFKDTGTGGEKDGVIEVRRGVEDLCLNKANYCQARIAVDGTHYLKGMVVYRDGKDMPDGIDVIFNTSKNSDVPVFGDKNSSVLKPLSDNKDNPFGATILQQRDLTMCQQKYIGADGKEHQSLINVVTEEGKWDTWSKTLASQFLSKQPVELAKNQLNLATAYKREEFDEIKNLTNPTLKKKLLEEFANGCESDAVHLKAAALPRQSSKVILPVTSLKENEIYAPGYKEGETVCLIRYPHEGRFEIPELVVTHRNKEAEKILGKTPTDAVGINHKTAEQLSGADFDGDTCVIIPVKNARGVRTVNVVSESYPQELKDFDNKQYRLPDGVKAISDKRKNLEMGIISNLITDMTLQGAPTDEIIRATKHSMVVIDAVKHRLDIAKSARDNGIAELHERYQGKATGGAVTIVSKAQSQDYAMETKDYYKIDPDTGKKITKETGATHLKASKSFKSMTDEEKKKYNKAQAQYSRTGVVPDAFDGTPYLKANKSVERMTDEEKAVFEKAQSQYAATGKVPDSIGGLKFKEHTPKISLKEERNRTKTTKMATHENAEDLMSPWKYPMEKAYAAYANSMKSMANEARKEIVATKNVEKSPSAAKTYSNEVSSLLAKLDTAIANAPKERMASRAANSEVRAILNEHPEYKSDPDKLKKIRNQALSSQRTRFGSDKKGSLIHINENEWKAIQAGALSSTKLRDIFNNCDSDELKKLATPKTTKASGLSNAKVNLMKSMKASGYTLAEIAEKTGYSPSTISSAINGTL